MKNSKPDTRIQVIDRAAALLETISRYSMPVTLKALSADTSLAPSTACRILRSLIDNRFVEQDGSGKYRLSGRFIVSCHDRSSLDDIRTIAVPYMEKLRDRFGETINLTSREGQKGIAGYAQRTNLPSYTRKTFSTPETLEQECLGCIEQGFAYDNEEAETGVGCIGVLIYGQYGEVIAGLSVSAPIMRRKDEWVDDLVATGKQLSAMSGYVEKAHSGR
ncbi:helix-turn-helix domain-containing protein [Endozoicomonas gorgoniicola]|uniref:HTH-type transcriptional repressor AllR n=1 Tax=Endozoicomonas gorgoniicola TaxID=1234144 RepID=A0ABT3MVR6_9GAMM|nr:IclR family transcriptional regulator C-terminal domain-containing protein [Endozoicomonas gorgoniicola]MCW7553472.1 helix-turn-helix domain-containing protein [Endozoicomonas gorgoniicola]